MKIIKNRYKYLAVSLLLMVLGIVFAVINASSGKGILNFDVQFVGGTSIEANIGREFDNNEVAKLVSDITGDSSVSVQKTGDGTSVIIKTKYLSGAITDRTDASAVDTANAPENGDDAVVEDESTAEDMTELSEEVSEALSDENEEVSETSEEVSNDESEEASEISEEVSGNETEEASEEVEEVSASEAEAEVGSEEAENAADDSESANDAKSAVVNALVEKYGITDPDKNISINEVSATISTEMWQTALLAVLVACIAMLLYITIRFRDFRTGASVVIALVHDVLIVLAFYAIVRVPVNSTFIAAILTVLGYSVNASIVIFDRIRENRGRYNKKSREELVDLSIKQSVTRSVFTSLTTLFTIAALYIFGVQSVKEFALPIIVGIVCGTYSSVFLAGSVWYMLSGNGARK